MDRRPFHHPRRVHRLVLYQWKAGPGENSQGFCFLVCLFSSIEAAGAERSHRILIETPDVFATDFTPVCSASVHSCGFTSSTAGEKSASACGVQGGLQEPFEWNQNSVPVKE